MGIEVIKTDITTLQVDAIVNAANQTLLGVGGVDGAIHRKAGPKLLAYCKPLNGCPTGQAKITPGFQLPAKWIIHTVGPVWRGGGHQEADLLKSCYENAFISAKSKNLKTIAFPCISTGVYGYPKKAAAEIALKVMKKYESDFDRIIACVFSNEDYHVYLSLISFI